MTHKPSVETETEFKRQHPVAAISKTLSYIRENLVTVFVGVVIGTRNTDMTTAFFVAAGVGLILISGVASWWRFRYRVTGDQLQIVSGLFVRKNLYLTKDRIQVIDISAGIVQRIFGLVRVDIQTAGSSSRAAAIEAVTLREAEEMKQQLRMRDAIGPETHGQTAGSAHAGGVEHVAGGTHAIEGTHTIEGTHATHGARPVDSTNPTDTAHPGELSRATTLSHHPETIPQTRAGQTQTYRLPGKDLLIAASTSGRFGVILSIMAALYGQLQPVLQDAEWLNRILALMPAQTGVLYAVNVAILFVLLAWLFSFFSTIINFSDFSVNVQPKELMITRGLFEKKRTTVPYNRIQSVYLSEGLMRQPFGLMSVHLNSAAYGDDKGGGTVQLFPLIARTKMDRLLKALVPGYAIQMETISPPTRSVRRYLFRSSVVPLIGAVALYVWVVASLWFLLLPAAGVLWGWVKYRDAAIGWDEQHLVIRERTLSRTTALLEFRRIQDATCSQTFFQRMRGLCTVRVHIASGDRGRSFACRDLREETGLELLRQVKRKKQTRERLETTGELTTPLP